MFWNNILGLGVVVGLLLIILRRQTHMAKTLADVLDEARQNTTVAKSLRTLVQGLKAKLEAAIAANDPALLQEIVDELNSTEAEIVGATVEGTVAEGEEDEDDGTQAQAPV